MRIARSAIFVVLLATIVVDLFSFLYGIAVGALNFPRAPSYVVGVFTLIIPILAGAWWFRLKAHRPILHTERLLFAAGVTLIDATVTVAVTSALQRVGLQLSLHLRSLIVILLISFAGAYFIAWLVTLGRRPVISR